MRSAPYFCSYALRYVSKVSPPPSAVMRNDTNPTPSSHAGCVANRCRTSGSSPDGPAQIGTFHPVERAAWTDAATIDALAQTTRVVAPARRAARIWVLTSPVVDGTVV